MMNIVWIKKLFFGLCFFTASMAAAVHAVPELDISAWDRQGTDSHTARMLITNALESGELTAEQAVAAYKVGGYDAARKLCKKYFTAKYDPEVGYDEAWYHRTLSEGLANASKSSDKLFEELCTLVARDLKEIRGAKLFEVIMGAASLNPERRAVFQKTFGIEAIPYKPITDFAAYFGVHKQDGTKGAHPNRTYMEKESLEQGLAHQRLVPGQVMTQTEGLLSRKSFKNNNMSWFNKKFTSSAGFLDKVHEKEREIIAQGRNPLMVPISWRTYYIMYMRTKMWEMMHDKKVDDFLFLHDAHLQSALTPEVLLEESETRERIVREGLTAPSLRVLCCYAGLFGGPEGYSSSSVIRKMLIDQGELTPCKCSKNNLKWCQCVKEHLIEWGHLGLGGIYRSFIDRFDKLLYKKWMALQPESAPVLMLSFDDETLEKCVYPSAHGTSTVCNNLQNPGVRREVMINGKTTSSVKEILHAYRTDPGSIRNCDGSQGDSSQFVCAVTQDIVENPEHQGVRISCLHDADQKKWQKFNAEFDSLLDEIRLDIVAMNKKKEYRKSFRRWMGLAGQVASTAYFASLGKDGAWYKRCGAGAAFFLSYFYMISPEW